MVVDTDPIYRLGLVTALEQAGDFQVRADFGRTREVVQRLEELSNQDQAQVRRGQRVMLTLPIDLVIWAVDARQPTLTVGVGLPQLLRGQYPGLPILVLLGQLDSVLVEDLRQLAVEGCWLKDANLASLLAAMRQVAAGQSVWDIRVLNGTADANWPVPVRAVRRLSLTQRVRQTLGDRSCQELAIAFAQLDQQLQNPRLGGWERLVLQGRYREMRAAQWFLANMFMPNPTQSGPSTRPAPEFIRRAPGPISQPMAVWDGDRPVDSEALGPSSSMAGELVLASEQNFQALKGALVEAVLAKLPTSLINATGTPLEIDILSPAKRQELLCIVLRGIEGVLDDLRFSQVGFAQLPKMRSRLLIDLWRQATADFFGKYATLPWPEGDPRAKSSSGVELVSVILADEAIVYDAILEPIALVVPWLTHVLFAQPLMVNNTAEGVGSPAAMRDAEALLANWVVQVANGVISPLLNHFATDSWIKQTFYDYRWLSTREIERFRNALSWHYRIQRLFTEPRDIFESQVTVLVFTDQGLRSQALYSPRDQELKTLSGIPFVVTLALEARDAIAPPLRATVTWVGRGVVFVLTQVVGRGIGLVGRGIIQGVGAAWQDARDGGRPSQGRSEIK
jgi:DNA-binding NarL/FixJ family response regulator